jgi:hypothetical protein
VIGMVRGAMSGLIAALSGGYLLTHAFVPTSVAWQEWVIQALTGAGLVIVGLSSSETWRGWRYVVRHEIQGSRRVTSLGSLRDAAGTLLVHLTVGAVNTVEMFRHNTYDSPNWLGWVAVSLLATALSLARRHDRHAIWSHATRNAETKVRLTQAMVDRGIPIPPEVVRNLQEDGLVQDDATPPPSDA